MHTIKAQLTVATHKQDAADAVLVTLEDSDRLFKFVHPRPHRQVGTRRKEHLGGHHHVEDHTGMAKKSLAV